MFIDTLKVFISRIMAVFVYIIAIGVGAIFYKASKITNKKLNENGGWINRLKIKRGSINDMY